MKACIQNRKFTRPTHFLVLGFEFNVLTKPPTHHISEILTIDSVYEIMKERNKGKQNKGGRKIKRKQVSECTAGVKSMVQTVKSASRVHIPVQSDVFTFSLPLLPIID